MPLMQSTTLHRSAFWLLGATVRDDRRRVVELAEERALELDPETCQKARADLTSPRTRLSAELAWLPGVSPTRARQLVEQLLANPMRVRALTGLPALARVNLMAAAFETTNGQMSAEEAAELIEEMILLVDDLAAVAILRDVNEDRAIARFPEVSSIEPIEAELAERRGYYKHCIKHMLDRLSTRALVTAMTLIAGHLTREGEEHGPALLDELIDSYEISAAKFLEQEAANAQKLLSAIKTFAEAGEGVARVLIEKLEAVTRNWDCVAQPIQLNAKARGVAHGASDEFAFSIRSVAVDLFNQHDMLEQSRRITALLQELFAEVPGVLERVEADVSALEDIYQHRAQASEERDVWAKSITYRAEVGMVFKTVLSISPEGIAKDDQRYALESVVRLRWGGVRRSMNGIPTGTMFTIAFGDQRSEAAVEFSNEAVFSAFIEKLWPAVGFGLMQRMLESLKAGGRVRLDGTVVCDDGIFLTKHKFLGAKESVFCPWSRVKIWSEDGSFCLVAAADDKTFAKLSYIDVANVHLVEQLVRTAFKQPGLQRLSELLT